MKQKKLILTVFIFLCVVLVVDATAYFHRASPRTAVSYSSSNLAIDKARYKALLNILGPQKTYAMFKKDFANKPRLSHQAMHFMGDLLYDYYLQKGMALEGLTTCDSTFDYGCYHQYIARLLLDHGLSVLNAVDKICIEKNALDCGHGIGHGLIEFLGPARLADALKACKTLSGRDISTCSSGAFMDYNIPLAIGPNLQVVPRTLDKNNPVSPCDKSFIPIDFRAECYFQLPHWWFQFADVSPRQIGQWCLLAPQIYQEKCFLGMGVDLPGRESYNVQKILSDCKTMPYENASNWCLSSCADSIRANTNSCAIYPKLGLDISLCKN